MKPSKENRRRHLSELSALARDWNPIGVPDLPPDEYDCIVGPLFRRLEAGASAKEIAAWLESELTEHFGIVEPSERTARFARQAVDWFRKLALTRAPS